MKCFYYNELKHFGKVFGSRLTLKKRHDFNAVISYRVWFKLDYKNKILFYSSIFLPPPSLYPFISLISGGRAKD